MFSFDVFKSCLGTSIFGNSSSAAKKYSNQTTFETIFPFLMTMIGKKGMNSSRKNTRCGNYEKVDKTIYNCFFDKRSQEIPIDEIDGAIQEKTLEFTKENWLLQNSKHQIVG